MTDNEAVDNSAHVDPASQDSTVFEENKSEIYIPNIAMN